MAKALKVVGTVAAVVALTLAIPGAGAAIGSAIGVSAGTMATVATVAQITAIAASIGAAALQRRPTFSREGNALQFQTNPQSGLPYPIGRTRMSGLRIHADTYDGTAFKSEGKQDVLSFAVMLGAGGPMQEIETFRADKETITFDGSGTASGTYANYMAQVISLGLAGASALALAFGGGNFPGWTADHKLSGIAHALWDLRYDEKGERFGAGVPEPEWIGKWVKVYDPRLDDTYPGGSGSHRALDESTYEWSRNPALHALTWALGRWQNGKRTLGIGAPVSNIRVADFVEAANVADANGWTCGGVEWSTDTKWAIFERMLQAGGAEPTMTGAMIGCRVNTPRVSIATVTSGDLLDNLTFSTTKSRRDRFNTVIPRYRSEDHDWEVISGSPVQVAAYVTEDGAPRVKEIDFPLVQAETGGTGDEQAGQLAAYEIVNSREAGPIAFSTGPKFIGIKTGDCITLDCPDQGLDAQPVIIRARSPDPVTLKIRFEAETETEEKHDFALGKTTTPPSTYAPTPPDLTPPTPSAVLWTLSAPTDATTPTIVVAGACEFTGADSVLVEYRRTDATDWSSVGKSDAGAPVNLAITGLDGGTAYEARVAYQSGDRTGDWLVLDPVTTVDAATAEDLLAAIANFNARNDRNGTTPVSPTVATDGTCVDHTLNANASADLSFEWNWGGDETTIDGFEVALFASDTGSVHGIADVLAFSSVEILPASKRAMIWYGVNPTAYYTMGLRAFRVVDPDVDPDGVIYSAWRQPSASGENPYRPASTAPFAGDVTGTINGTSAANVASATSNFNARNDRDGTTPATATTATDGTCVDHTLNANGSADISFEWAWGGAEASIDGFEIGVYASTTATAYTPGTTPSAEQRSTYRPNIRAFILPGVDPTLYYTIAVRPFRVVDPDVNAAGVIYGAWKKSSIAGENPYRPASSVAWTGDVSGTINGTSAANVATWSGFAFNGLNADGTVKDNKVVDGSILPGVINLAGYVSQAGTFALTTSDSSESYFTAAAVAVAEAGGVVEVLGKFPYQIEVTNPVQNTEYYFDLYLILYKNIGGSWFDIYVSSTFRVSDLWSAPTATGTFQLGRKLFDIHTRFAGLAVADWTIGWGVATPASNAALIYERFFKIDLKKALA